MTSTHYTRRRSTTAAIVVVLALVFAPALTPAALAYDAKASGPDASARLILPDWDRLDRGTDPFDGKLIPRRAMEHPREGDWGWWLAAGVGLFNPMLGAGIWVLQGAAMAFEEILENDETTYEQNWPHNCGGQHLPC